MIFKDEEKKVLHEVVGRNIDMYSDSLLKMVDTDVDPDYKLTVLKAKQNCDRVYEKLAQEQDLDRDDMMVLVVCIQTTVQLLMNHRANINESIRILEEYFNKIVNDEKLK